jgi:hypothetical protein
MRKVSGSPVQADRWFAGVVFGVLEDGGYGSGDLEDVGDDAEEEELGVLDQWLARRTGGLDVPG